MPIKLSHVHDDPTQDELLAVFKYNPANGQFTWADPNSKNCVSRRKSHRINKPWCGTKVLSGRLFINWGKRQKQANRLAWIISLGAIPDGMEVGYLTPLDPCNPLASGNYANRLENLVLITRAEFNNETQKRIEKRARDAGNKVGRRPSEGRAKTTIIDDRVNMGAGNIWNQIERNRQKNAR